MNSYDDWLRAKEFAVIQDKTAFAAMHLQQFQSGELPAKLGEFQHFTVFACECAIGEIASQILVDYGASIKVKRAALLSLLLLAPGSTWVQDCIDEQAVLYLVSVEDNDLSSQLELSKILEALVAQSYRQKIVGEDEIDKAIHNLEADFRIGLTTSFANERAKLERILEIRQYIHNRLTQPSE